MLSYSIIALIMSNAVNNRRDLTILYSRIALLILIFCSFFTYNIFYYDYINNGIIILNGLFCIENYSVFFSLVILLISVLIIGITSVFNLKKNNNYIFKLINIKNVNWKNRIISNTMNEHYRIMEYPLILLFCIIGTIFLMLSFDIISIFLSIELQSYALYLICSIYRNSESSTNAGLTYFLLGGLSSCIILLGLTLLYVNTGNSNLENFYILNNISDIFYYSIIYNNNIVDLSNTSFNNINIVDILSSINIQYVYIQISLIIMSVGFLFKIGSAPFHFWSPDVYDAVPTVTTTFIAIIPKISILIFLYKILYYTSSNIIILSWVNNIVLSSILSLIIGSILGLTQFRIKRLFAYSTISHIGFILICLSINNIESSKAFFFYLLQYSISNFNAFLILIVIGYTLQAYYIDKEKYNIIKIKDMNYSPIQLISQLKGYFNINPALTISLSLTLFSFAGIPPLMGFFAKQLVLTAALNTNMFLIVIIAIITSVISAVYYLVIIKLMCFDSENYKINNNKNTIKNDYYISSYYSFCISFITLTLLLFLFFESDIYRILYIII